MEEIVFKLVKSWANEKGNVNTTEELLEWIKELNENTYVSIKECNILDGSMWFYDDYNGEVLNRKRSFFSIKGMRLFVDDEFVSEQPIIIQPEIGYLGIICKEIDGELNFLMQAKIEPGNINCVQISPTIQATKSNFTRAHGGRLPAYFDYFENSNKYRIIYDQVQSEQAARFYKKRNRNMIMLVEDELPLLPNFKWMTLGQIKKLMELDNIVNMDTRSVLAGMPFASYKYSEDDLNSLEPYFKDKAAFKSLFMTNPHDTLVDIFGRLNNYKMFRDTRVVPVPLNQLVDWKVDDYGISCLKKANFMVRYYDIEISGREVHRWMQPLFKAAGEATFGLVSRVENGVRKFLVKIRPEIGSFDKVELGPSVLWEPTYDSKNDTEVDRIFRRKLQEKEGIIRDVMLSEEGGRFFHEQNRNVIMEIDEDIEIGDEYIWADYSALNFIVHTNNVINIQLRNLMSLLSL